MSKGVHRFAVFVACATFFLIIAGANVTSHDAGLATSDWPLSNGQVFPKMVGNLFWEHGHRMVATAVGILTIVLAFYLQFREPRTWVKRLGWAALGAVVAQGLLGGLTVKLNLPLIVSATHATLAQLFFLITVSLAVFTSKRWIESEPLEMVEGPPVRAPVARGMAARARGLAVERKPRIPEQRPAELGFGRPCRRARLDLAEQRRGLAPQRLVRSCAGSDAERGNQYGERGNIHRRHDTRARARRMVTVRTRVGAALSNSVRCQ